MTKRYKKLLKEEILALEDVYRQKVAFHDATRQLVTNQEKELIFFSEMIERKKKQLVEGGVGVVATV
jgi:hypothetical protein